MLKGHAPGLTDQNAGCTMSPTGLCTDCPLFFSMPVDVTDPRTGETLPAGSVWDCALIWQALGSWDAGRQAQGVHHAIAQQTNEQRKQSERFLSLASGHRPEALPDAAG